MIFVAHILTVLIMPVIFVGLINRTKAIWAGRKGFPILQLYYDLLRLFRKVPVYSSSTSWIFQFSCVFVLASTLIAASLVPLFPGFSLISFQYDFVFMAYLFALGKIFLILGALDTASSFEGMGASREATFSALIEPTLFIILGTLSFLSKSSSLNSIATAQSMAPNNLAAVLLCAFALFFLLLTESSRIPVDDPNTHLELTMIHEVMILDHSGFDLALIQYASAIKMTVLAGLVASLINPFSITNNVFKSIATSLLIICCISIIVGLAESVMPRIRLKTVPHFIFIAFLVSLMAMTYTLLLGWSNP